MTDVLEAAATIHAPPTDVYALLRDVEGYGAYSDHVADVVRHEGAPATYDVTLTWWTLSYTVALCVTDTEPPDRIEWRLTEGLDAQGVWELQSTTVDDPTVDAATAVTLTVRYDPDSADVGALSLPPLVPVSAIVERARPVVEQEAGRVLTRVVADLEDEPRQATLTVRA